MKRKLEEFGCDEVVTGLGRTGVVGLIRGRNTSSKKVIGFDMFSKFPKSRLLQ